MGLTPPPPRHDQNILDDLWRAIRTEFPEPPPPPTELEHERAFHMHFVEDRSGGFIGRSAILGELLHFVQDEQRTDSLPTVVLGPPVRET